MQMQKKQFFYFIFLVLSFFPFCFCNNIEGTIPTLQETSEIQEIVYPNSITVLVDKYHKLSSDYVPRDLTPLSYQPYYLLRKEAADAFEEMVESARLFGHYFYPFSAYRSYARQEELYQAYVLKDGEAIADHYSAKPGHSEHQTGLTVDVRSAGLLDNVTTEDYAWLKDYAHHFGFIIRYPENKNEITGYISEPWHLRYVGKKVATHMKKLGITFDEYYRIYIKN